MSLLTVSLSLVSPYGTDDKVRPATGRVELIPASHGKYEGSLRTVERRTAQILNGEMEPLELTPGVWNITVIPIRGNPWPTSTVTLDEGMEEPVNLADLAPDIVVNAKAYAKGDPGPSIVDWENNEDGTVKFLLSDGTYTDSGAMPTGPRGERGPKGDQGPAGPSGSQGVEGPKGDQGTQGPIGPAGMEWRGNWSPETDYINDDSVYHNGSSWFAAGDPDLGEEPSTDSAHWNALAMQGAQGIKGDRGIQGPQGEQGLKGDPGSDGATTWEGITDKPDLSAFVSSTSISSIWAGTQAQYDALTPDPGTVYVIKEA